jgi:aspartyl-tRNA(Asn)/glutamyl-tRNA(Gln) amidotransferase subunit B
MQEGSFRCDANVSVRKAGERAFGTRCEIKNLNSFRFMERAIEFEARRQIEILEDGGRIEQETRLFDPERGETRAMRSKEDAHDYRYFPDPDLLPVVVSEQTISGIERAMPELPEARRGRFVREYALPAYDATLVTASRAAADYFESLVAASGAEPKLCANWQTGALNAALNESGLDIAASRVAPEPLARLLKRIADGTISNNGARQVFEALWTGATDVDAEIEARGLKQMSDTGELEAIVHAELAANAKSVEEYRAGKDKAFNALVGQAMKATKGKANPAQVNELLKKKLG